MELKRCTKCGDEKQLSTVYFQMKTKNRFSSVCKVCIAKYDKEYRCRPKVKARNGIKLKNWYSSHKNIVNKKCKAWNENNWVKRLFGSIKRHAKVKEINGKTCEFSITPEHIERLWNDQSGLCYFTKVPMTTKMYKLETVSVDRLDSSRGYTTDNIVLSTKAINLAKGSYSAKEFMAFLEKVKSS